jgi:hypothetical protein
MAPLVAARKALNVTPVPADPDRAGPFAFADDGEGARHPGRRGFESIAIERYDTQVVLGPSPRAAAERALRIGPTARLAREVEDSMGIKHILARRRERAGAVRRVRWSGDN